MPDYNVLHKTFNSLTKHHFPYSLNRISNNGIYVMFENGERYSTLDRIVRVGSHTGAGRLHERIDEHFITSDHRDSIFRKHLGRCFLNVDDNSDYIPIWNLLIKKREDKTQNYSRIDWDIEKMYERKVTDYIRQSFSFIVISNLRNEKTRCRLEKGLLATLAQAPEKINSNNWLGIHHPNETIRTSKLWNIRDLKGCCLTDEDFDIILECLSYSD